MSMSFLANFIEAVVDGWLSERFSRGDGTPLVCSDLANERDTAIRDRDTRRKGKDCETKRSIPSPKLIKRPIVPYQLCAAKRLAWHNKPALSYSWNCLRNTRATTSNGNA